MVLSKMRQAVCCFRGGKYRDLRRLTLDRHEMVSALSHHACILSNSQIESVVCLGPALHEMIVTHITSFSRAEPSAGFSITMRKQHCWMQVNANTAAKRAASLSNLQTFISVAAFTSRLLTSCPKALFQPWAKTFTVTCMNYARRYPMLSGLYRLLTAGLQSVMATDSAGTAITTWFCNCCWDHRKKVLGSAFLF